MKYLKKFDTEADVAMSITPNVVLADDTGSVLYNVVKGVFIQHVDGTLYTTSEWTAGGFANDQANGVAVCDISASFVIAKEYISYGMTWSSNTSSLVSGVVATDDSTIAKTDYAGAANTALIAAIDTSKAAYSCANYAFPNGAKGHLPALGEWAIAFNNKRAVNSAMSLIGGVAFSSNYHWSSTQINGGSAWVLTWSDGDAQRSSKASDSRVRAFLAL